MVEALEVAGHRLPERERVDLAKVSISWTPPTEIFTQLLMHDLLGCVLPIASTRGRSSTRRTFVRPHAAAADKEPCRRQERTAQSLKPKWLR